MGNVSGGAGEGGLPSGSTAEPFRHLGSRSVENQDRTNKDGEERERGFFCHPQTIVIIIAPSHFEAY